MLNRDTKQFGRQFLVDGSEETCWNSDSGDQQTINVTFKQPTTLAKVDFQFQGGFSSRKILLQYCDQSKTVIQESTLHPIDNNLLQEFKDFENISANSVKIVLNDLSDMFGRVILYQLKLYTSS